MRRFERQGIEATTEVQAAARKVAKENILLRALLEAHGVKSIEIDDYLLGNHYKSNITPFPLKADKSASETKTGSAIQDACIKDPQSRAPGSSGKGGSCPQNNVPSMLPEMNDNSNYVLPQVAEVSKLSTCYTSGIELGALTGSKMEQVARPISAQNIGKAATASATKAASQNNMPPLPEMPSPHIAMDDESTCEAAANIIANMRGHGDAETVMAELGCSTNRDCNVKNLTIFELLDG